MTSEAVLKSPFGFLRKIEDGFAVTALLLMAGLPVLELFLRTLFGSGITGSSEIVQHLTLWVGFLGAALASREERHLSLSAGINIVPKKYEGISKAVTSMISTAIAASLAWASYEFVRAEMESASQVAGFIPEWMVEVILPISFTLIAFRFIWHAGSWGQRAFASLGLHLAFAIGLMFGDPFSHPDQWEWAKEVILGFGTEGVIFKAISFLSIFLLLMTKDKWARAFFISGLAVAYLIGFKISGEFGALLWPAIGLLIASAMLGSPIFVVLGGSALILFFSDFVPAAAVPVETYRIVVSASIPAIPLFTLAGFVLAESKTSERLVRLFRALFGWMPGGLVVSTTLVCAFFSTFTGASGVTILALGGLLLPVLLKNGYKDRFATGLLTSTGSIGLLFPPSLAVILYGVVARVPISDLFIAGIIPGIIMVVAVAAYGVWQGKGGKIKRPPFDAKEALSAMREAKWEIFLPIIVLYAIFGGITSLIEAAAITAAYAIFTETVIHRDISVTKDLPRILVKCMVMLGGIFVILGVAMGLTNYLVDAMIPMQAADWVEANVEDKIVFLLALNVFLLVVGALMDIFSAIVVVVPLIIPISEIYGIHPLHLGMIFLVNLELGYLTPPVGMNLFLASYRLDKPLMEVYKAAVPFLIVLALVVLLITYVPELIIGVD